MKFRLGACAAVVLLAACSGQKSDSDLAALQNSAASKPQTAALKTGRAAQSSIANAPDRGALMSYKNQGKPTLREGAFTYYPIAMSEAHAIKGVVDGHMTVPTPDGRQLQLKLERHNEGIDGNWSWIGRVEGGDPNQEAIITFGEHAVFASIPQGEGAAPLQIQTRNGALYAVQVDPSKLRSPNKGHNDVAIPMASAIAQAAQAQIAQKATAVAAGAPATAANTIDVAIGYTPGYRTSLQGQSVVATRLLFLIEVANQGLSNSNVNGYLRLVNALEVNYTDTNTNQTALQELTGSNGSSNVTIPAALTPLRTARDTYGADVAILVRDFQQPEQQGCGIAWLIGANGATVNPANDARWGYGVVSDGDDLGTDGNSYYCAAESLVHEVGHLLGSAHDQANATSPGRFPYSYGYKNNTANFFTIMAYGDEGQTPYRFFSNPSLTACAGQPCGTATADNARSLNQTIPVVAQFRATVVSFAGSVPSDFNGDGKSEVHWRNSQTGYNHQWIMDGRFQSAWSQVYRETDFSWKVVGTGDFNGDNRADIIWRNTTSGRVYIQFMSGPSTLGSSGPIASVADMGWQLAALADFNADGRTDILWRNINDGRNVVWAMNGLAVASTTQVYLESNQNWMVAGSADFNGDGYTDVLWRNIATGENYIQMMSGTTTLPSSGRIASVPDQQWKIVAIRDFDIDGYADIYWRNAVTGANALWLMNGLQVASINYVYNEPNVEWKIVNSGDYNGDGRPDLFWRNSTTGQNYVQLMNGTQILPASGATTTVADQAWQVTPN